MSFLHKSQSFLYLLWCCDVSTETKMDFNTSFVLFMSKGFCSITKEKSMFFHLQNSAIPTKLPEPIRASEAVAKKSQTKARLVKEGISERDYHLRPSG